MSAEAPSATASIGLREGWVAAVYFCFYLAYLFVRYESELLHWLTLVALPLALVFLLRRGEVRRRSEVLASFGLRKGRLMRGMGWALLMGGALGLYHLPYAYFNPAWPSAGDWGAAWISAMGQGVPGGLLLGVLYLVSRRNVLACAVLHSLISALPAMTMIRFSGG